MLAVHFVRATNQQLQLRPAHDAAASQAFLDLILDLSAGQSVRCNQCRWLAVVAWPSADLPLDFSPPGANQLALEQSHIECSVPTD